MSHLARPSSFLFASAALWLTHCSCSSKDGGTSGSDGGTASGGSSGSASGGAQSTGGGVASGGGVGTGGAPPTGSTAALVLEPSVQDAGRSVDRVTWRDSSGAPRTTSLVRKGAGYARQFSYRVDGQTRTCIGTGVNGWDGFGYVVNHYANTAAVSQNVAGGTFGPVFVGRHHAVYEYAFEQNLGQPVKVLVHWMFATGRDHPIYAITYDLSGIAADVVRGDTRSPYGDVFWEGASGPGTSIAGVGWGDRYRFVTKSAPLTMNSEWDYSERNTVPYAFAWATSPDAEMGLVQTEPYERKDGGGYWNYANWGKTSANQTRTEQQAGRMPVSWNWTYQINQYELCTDNASCIDRTTDSHRLAWGSNYGALGGDGNENGPPGTYNAYGDDKRISGYPHHSYSVYVVLGTHTAGAVQSQVTNVESATRLTLTASTGAIKTQVPAGVGRADTRDTSPPGYDARYGTWSATMIGGVLRFSADAGNGFVPAPIVVIDDYAGTTAPSVTVDGRAQAADADVFVSVDAAKKQAWITFAAGFRGRHDVEVRQ